MPFDLPPKPLVIGLTTRYGDPVWVEKNNRNYINILAEYGVTPTLLAPDAPAILPSGLVFHPDQSGRLPVAILDYLDGLVFSGGGDVDPTYFGQPLNGAELESIDRQRDELELGLGEAALAIDLPIFGICSGCQVLNVAAGGSMVQHLPGHRSSQEGTAFHPVAILPHSRLRLWLGTDSLQVNTFHHQGIDQASLAPRFQPASFAQPDAWLIEAYESPEHRWVVGVQWHPERSFELEDGHRRLWESFLAACAAYREERGRGRQGDKMN